MASESNPPSSDLPALPTESSSILLRFPTPDTSGRTNSWIQDNTEAVNMSLSVDESTLGDSLYEFIDTDGEESRDGNNTESIASTDLDRPDDVTSLADTEQSNETEDEDEVEEHAQGTSAVPMFPSLEQEVENAFNTPTLGRSSNILDDLDRPFTQSIEFKETGNFGAEIISVKHTVADISDEQAAEAIKGMNLETTPDRIGITIRQTMTKQGLSTREPLRILYVGSHSAKQDIIHKIASSITAPVESGKQAHRLRQSQSQLYNVVPVSAFGSEQTPEIELMHSSGYQIKVEDCQIVESMNFEDSPERPDVIKLNVDDHVAYHSIPEGQGFIVEPWWELPHVAIFYCSDSDNTESRRTRTLARKFMDRHGVPSIVISHRQLFNREQCIALDQHSVHMCLESRDPHGRGNIIHQRLPIDLASFLNIDARQMNRNLAYITGLYDRSETTAQLSLIASKSDDTSTPKPTKNTGYCPRDLINFTCLRNRAEWRTALPLGLLVLGLLSAIFSGVPGSRFSSVPAISINSRTMPAVSISSTSTSTLNLLPAKITSTPTSAAVKTSTHTVTVTQSSGPNSLSVLPSMELGSFLKATRQDTKSSKSVCTAEILGDREILIRIPSATKLSWLTKEAMSVNITRNKFTVETERAFSSDEGIVLLLAKKEAYGVLNISIVTTKKPRINETFQLDFGTTATQAWQTFTKNLYSCIPDKNNIVAPAIIAEFQAAVVEMLEDAKSVVSTLGEIKKTTAEHVASAGSSLTEVAKSASIEVVKRSAIVTREVGFRAQEAEAQVVKGFKSLQQIREPLSRGLLKAQIRSKVVWLRMLGKHKESESYTHRAAEALRKSGQDGKYGGCNRKTPSWSDRKSSFNRRPTKKTAKKQRK